MKKLAVVSGSGKSWTLTTPFGTFDRHTRGSMLHSAALAKTRLAESAARGSKQAATLPYRVGFKLFSHFSGGKPVYGVYGGSLERWMSGPRGILP